ncbi:hypothetical protein CIB48_g9429 [Xylaria polymorpha]|nr:hypothetical protein CIB48_g9429 [Xylaria polymorpha]
MVGKKQPAPTKPSKGGASKPTNSRGQKPAQTSTTTETRESEEDLRRQQTLLNVFSNTFRDVLEADDFASQLQEVKGALFNRDFEGAFAREAPLDVYAARWSPTRALCYARVLRELDVHLKSLVGETSACVDHSPETKTRTWEGEDEHERTRDDQDGSAAKEDSLDTKEQGASKIVAEKGDTNTEEEEEGKPRPLKILAIGGAAAEIVAFADYISSQASSSTATTPLQGGEITLLDIGPWGTVTSRLQTALTSTPPISRYASAAAKAENAALVPSSQFQSTFIQADILSLPSPKLSALMPAQGKTATPVLITLLFTLNELYTAGGIKRTTAFLRQLSSPSTSLAPGSLLLVVDSPGSYSEAAVGGGGGDVKKRYPMQWLLEHTLIPPVPSKKPRDKEKENKKPGQDENKEDLQEGADLGQEKEKERGGKGEDGIRWEKIESHDSVWFRVADGLRYPIPLENMRYQMHLYRACAG